MVRQFGELCIPMLISRSTSSDAPGCVCHQSA
jgi:hypothetical protein